MQNSWEDRLIGLAGVFQAVALVDQLAKTGYLETENFETCISSLFSRNPQSAEAVYGSSIKLLKGLEKLELAFKDHKASDQRDLIRYALGVIHLQKALSKNTKVLNEISSRLDKAEIQSTHFSLTHDNVIGNIADIYSDTISKFKFRIHVSGEYHYLNQERVANQIRALLLTAIRGATLWRQCGGSRWQLLIQRKHLLKVTRELIAKSKQQLH